jgi:hypothetical protein
MVSEKQLVVNRQNAQLGGVKTEAGKAVSSQNAITHGLLSKQALVRVKDPDLLAQLREDLMVEHEPQGALETMFVDRIASGIWRLRRAQAAESAILMARWDHGARYPFVDAYMSGGQNLNRHEIMIERQVYKAARTGKAAEPGKPRGCPQSAEANSIHNSNLEATGSVPIEDVAIESASS